MALWTVALDSEGQRINIDKAQRGKKYTCINCGEAMMAKRGRERDHHFSHYSFTEQCDHDGWLHKEILSVLMLRLAQDELVLVDTPDGSLDLADNLSYSKEKKYENWVPDVLIKKAAEILFVEVCVTSPCSEDKINSGHKIIEIVTEDARSIDELRTGEIHTKAKYYTLRYYNFESQKRVANPEEKQTNTPDIISIEDERQVSVGGNPSNEGKRKLDEVNIPYCPQLSSFNGKHASFFILHENGLYEVKQSAEFCSSDILVMGINTLPDFALNIGKAYAWKKGLLSVDALTVYEQKIDIPTVVTSFSIVELSKT
ncbi:MAG: hypothetical protein IKW20_02200 [Bacteroidales bacterium]|nr:hypothetical protein [Bacteroidales bacterium]MBR5833716.1 hypothetical protein [Bacteroidales bacterium]